jgi:hypothetical protein
MFLRHATRYNQLLPFPYVRTHLRYYPTRRQLLHTFVPNSFHNYFRQSANITILLAISSPLQCTLTSKNSHWTFCRRVRDLLTISAPKVSPKHCFTQSYKHHNKSGLNKGLNNSNNHWVKLLYVELKTLLLKIKHNMKDINEHA